MSTATFTVYGATGYTGRLVAAEAARLGLPLRLAGRRRDALETLAAGLGGDVDVACVDIEDVSALAALAADSRVLASCVGPYEQFGRPVVDAALGAGCHYLDVSAELDFLGWVQEQRDRAADAGCILCPGVGFDGAPGDLLLRLAANSLGGAVREARIGYLVRGGRMSAGSLRSALGMLPKGGRALVDGDLVAEPLMGESWAIPFPEPLGTAVGVSIPSPEVLTVGQSIGARNARSYLALPGRGPASRIGASLAKPAARALTSVLDSPARDPLRAAVGLLPDGPSERGREGTRAALLAEVSGPTGHRRAWLRLRDIYGVTARFSVGVAARLLEAPRGDGGVRTPAQAVGSDPGGFLSAVGAHWDIIPEA